MFFGFRSDNRLSNVEIGISFFLFLANRFCFTARGEEIIRCLWKNCEFLDRFWINSYGVV